MDNLSLECDIRLTVKQALIKETVHGQFELAELPKNFYKVVNNGDMSVTGVDLDRLKIVRLKKILSMASVGPMTEDIARCLSDEERILYHDVFEKCSIFIKGVSK